MLSSFQRWGLIAGGAGLLLALAPARAAVTVEFDIQPRVLHVGESAQAQFTVRGEKRPTTPPLQNLPGLQVSDPAVGSQTTIINGRVDHFVTFTYQLMPTRTGRIKVGPQRYLTGGQSFALAEIELQVLPLNAATDNTPATAGAAGASSLADLVFARLTAEPVTVYQQQSFTIQLAVYFRDINLDRNISLSNWQPEGLSLSAFQELAGTRAVISNQIYNVRQFRCQARALSSGRISLTPTVRGGLVIPRARRQRGGVFSDPFMDSFFDNPFFAQSEIRPIDIDLTPLDITVKPWPAEGRPPNFSGAVGRFTMEARVQPQDVAVGDPVTVTVQLEGQGNLETLAAPVLAASDNFKVYEAKLTSKDVNDTQTAGRKVFEQVLIPRSTAATNLPALAFSYFNPGKGVYETLTRGPFRLQVRPSAAGAVAILKAGELAPTATPEGRDIVYLKPAPARWASAPQGSWLTSPGFWGLQALPLLAVGVTRLISRRRAALSQDLRRARRLRAPRSARAAIRQAEIALRQGQRGPFFEALWTALAAYFGNRLNLAPGEVSFEALAAAAQRAATPPALLERIRRLLAQCEQERFGRATHPEQGAPALPADEGEPLIEELQALLRAFERIRL
ncbi:MAG: BatD family protein [Kiritimatiellaeota bacterium]|nr:BatD family protein [Kiritimatiellota bacterium]